MIKMPKNIYQQKLILLFLDVAQNILFNWLTYASVWMNVTFALLLGYQKVLSCLLLKHYCKVCVMAHNIFKLEKQAKCSYEIAL